MEIVKSLTNSNLYISKKLSKYTLLLFYIDNLILKGDDYEGIARIEEA